MIHLVRRFMNKTTFFSALLIVFLVVPARGQSTQSDDLRKSIDTMNETQKAILSELQEIRKLLATQQPRPAADALPANPVNIAREPFKGAPNAKVAVIEFSDYQCPFCSRYVTESLPQLAKEYIDTGKVKYVWRDLPLDFHKQAFKAAEAAHCAGEQGRFWEMHDVLFANQKNLMPEDLTRHAAGLQLDASQFQQCLSSDRFAT